MDSDSPDQHRPRTVLQYYSWETEEWQSWEERLEADRDFAEACRQSQAEVDEARALACGDSSWLTFVDLSTFDGAPRPCPEVARELSASAALSSGPPVAVRLAT
jgi:hypothetical protein